MRAFLTVTERLEIAARLLLVYALIGAMFLLDIAAAPDPLAFLFVAPYTLMALYYWTISRPLISPAIMAFTLGLLLDILGGYPLGLFALLFTVVRLLLAGQRRVLMAQGFVIFWVGFVIVSALTYISAWAIMSLVNWHFLPLTDLIQPILMGSLLFPLVSAFLSLTHKIL